jgi:chorismate mutase
VGAQKPRAHEERTQEVDRDVFTFVTNNGDATTVLTTRKPTPLTPEQRQQVMEEVALHLGSGGRTVDDLAEEVWDEVAEENLALRSVYDDDASYF